MLTAGAWASAQFGPAEPPAGSPAPGGMPEVVATVAGEPITADLYMQALNATTRRLLANPQAQQQGITQLNNQQRRMVLDSIINNRVALHLAKEAGVEVSDEEVEEFVEMERSRFPSEEVFENFLRSEGLTLEVMRERTREMLRIQGLNEVLTGDIEVAEEEIQELYESMKDEGRLNAPKTWDFRHILIRHDIENEGAAEAEARAIHARISEGEDFATVAEEVSDDLNSRENGGLYRNVPRGRGVFMDDFEEQAFSLREDELSEPFSSQMGWHVVRMEAVHEAGLMSYERVSDSLENQMLVQRQQQVVQERLAQAREVVPIEIFIQFGSDAPVQQPGGSAIDDVLRQLDSGS